MTAVPALPPVDPSEAKEEEVDAKATLTKKFREISSRLDEKTAKCRATIERTNTDIKKFKKKATDSKTQMSIKAFQPE